MAPTGAIRVVVAKPGLDGHDRGAKVVARALRDAGVEVIYTGLHQTPEQIVATAIQEDADAVGLSVLSGAHMTLFRRVLDLLAQQDAEDIVVFGGGIIPEDDVPLLEQMGVARVFRPGATTYDIVAWVNEALGEQSPAQHVPTGNSPAADSPAADSPAADSPAAEPPAADSPAAEPPGADSPAADSPDSAPMAQERPA